MTGLMVAARSALPAPLRGLGVWAWVAATVLAAAVFVVGNAVGQVVHQLPAGVAVLAGLLQSGTIVVGLARPRVAAVLHLAGVFLAAIFANAGPQPASVVTMIALAFMLLVLAAAAPRWVGVTTWVSACLGLTIIAVARGTVGEAVGTNLIVTAAVTFPMLMLGLLWVLWWHASVDLGRARVDAEAEQAARVWVEERARVAREMHDVVAHSMSIVHMRATSAKYRIHDLPEAAVDELDGIAAQAREALAEMRGVLGVLRGDDAAQFAPQPGLRQLQELVDGARAADLDLTAVIAVIDPPPPDSVQLALYRVAQEAIANIVRHAPGASATLSLTGGEQVTLRIANHGGGPTAAPDHGGSGIRGMIERMSAIGGSLSAGPSGDGFEVIARAPGGSR